ncbi:hypothetical protein ACH4TQ_06540 [Streptomyces sp. NPDC021218]|uniref:hypothetical protein n=1 Tax=Streptomyces sp. NPDC021218 TaxID=3365119 RepID=UPI00379AA1D1
MAVPNAVRWADIDPAKIENIISVLISRIHPEAQRIDGSGGDGGRDVQVPLADGLVIYEVKSFTGRLDKSRRSQIKKSLKNASAHNPKHWHLVMPLDMTPKELDWYADLKSEYAFVSHFTRGKTWLDSELSRRPEISRYYTGDSNSEIVNYLREIREEEAALPNGVPDAVDRIKRLISRLNEVDPHYVFGVHVGPDGAVKTEAHPRYPGAELDRPVVIKAKFAFPKTPEGEAAASGFMESIDYGVPTELPGDFVHSIEVDAPAGMGGTWPGGTFSIGAASAQEPDGQRYSAVIADTHGHLQAAIPLRLLNRFRGGKGAQIQFGDITGFFGISARLNVAEKTAAYTFSFEHREDTLPSALLPTLRFLTHLKAGNQWGLAVNNEVAQLHSLTDAFMPELAEYGRYISALATLQDFTGFSFSIPEILPDEDGRRLKLAIHLIEGKEVVSKWDEASITFTKEGAERWRATTGTNPGQLLLHEDFYADICGNSIYVGQVRKHIASARVDELPEIGPGAPKTDTFPVRLIPGDDATVRTTLVPREREEF